MRVLFPLISAGSGSDIFIHNLVSSLKKESISTDICNLSPWLGLFPPIAGSFCDHKGYDIVHANAWNGYAFKKGKPLVVTEYHVVQDPVFAPYTSLTQKVYYQYLYYSMNQSFNNAEAVTAISKYTQKKIQEIFGYSDSKMIYCGVEPSIFRSSKPDKSKWGVDEKTTLLLYVGNHIKRKGADLLEPIMKNLGDDFLLLTTSGLRTTTKIQSANIRPLGKMNLQGLVDAYNTCDILLFPSRLEGFGLCVAEAMACGKPVITTNSSSLPELIDQDKGGILCEIDDVSGFTEAVRYLAEDENLQMSMGKYNRQKVMNQFTLEKMAKEYASLYTRL